MIRLSLLVLIQFCGGYVVRLPKTELPLCPLPSLYKEAVTQDQKVYESQKNEPTFVLCDGPPYANGPIHVGHVLNKTLKDFVVRFKILTGNRVSLVPGWDTNGLPILLQAKASKPASSIGISDWCRQYAEKQIEIQKNAFINLGVLADWENAYRTHSPPYVARELRILKNLHSQDLVYYGNRPVRWSPTTLEPVADAEVSKVDRSVLRAVGCFKLSTDDNMFLAVPTDQPYILPILDTIVISESANLSIVSESDSTKFLIDATLIPYWPSKLVIHSHIKPRDLPDSLYFIDWQGVEKKVLIAEEVPIKGVRPLSAEHNISDFLLLDRLGFRKSSNNNFITETGVFNKIEDLEGKAIFDYASIFNAAKSKPQLLLRKINKSTSKIEIETRSGVRTFHRSTSQWFVHLPDLIKRVERRVSEARWTPGEAQGSFIELLSKREGDWCISRQRGFGNKLPSKKLSEGGAELAIDSYLQGDFVDDAKGHNLDVWFDSGIAWSNNYDDYEFNRNATNHLCIEGRDQLRGWFQSTWLTSIGTQSNIPFKHIYIHGFVTDSQRQKMSKSKGNVYDPADLIKRNPDILRLWVATVNPKHDVQISRSLLLQVEQKYRRIRNFFKFLLSNIGDYEEDDEVELGQVDEWVLGELGVICDKTKCLNDEILFNQGLDKINRFINMCSKFYFTCSKDRLYVGRVESRRQVQYVFYNIMRCLIIVLTPILPFLMQELLMYAKKDYFHHFRRDPFDWRSQNTALNLEWPKNIYRISEYHRDQINTLLAIKSAIDKTNESFKKIHPLSTSKLTITPKNNALAQTLKLFQKSKKRSIDDLRFIFNVPHIEINHQSIITPTPSRDTFYATSNLEHPDCFLALSASPYPLCNRCRFRFEEIRRGLCSTCEAEEAKESLP